MRLLLLIFMIHASCLMAQDQDSAKLRAKQRLATLSASRQVLDSLENLPKLEEKDRVLLTDALCGSITNKLADHVKRNDSMNKSKVIIRELQLKSLESRIADIVNRVGDQSQLPLRVDDVKAALGGQWSSRVDKAIEKCMEGEYAKLYDAARSRAVSLVRHDVEQRIRFPSEAELDARLKELFKDRPDDARLKPDDDGVIRDWLAGISAPGSGPVLEELQQFVADSSRKQYDEIRSQYEQRLGVLNTSVPLEKRKADAISDFLLGTLSDQVTAKKKAANDTAVPVYGFVPVLQRNINSASAALEKTRLRDYLASVPAPMDIKDMAGEIRNDPKSHVSPADSELAFIAKLVEAGRLDAAQNYAKGARPSVGAEYFGDMLKNDASLMEIYSKRVKAEVKRQLPEARRLVAEEQFKKYFSQIDKNVLLGDEAIVLLQDKGGARIGSISEAVSVLKKGGYSDVSDPGGAVLLKEVSDRFLDLANLRFSEAAQAATAQLALLRQLETVQMDKLRKDVSDKKSVKDILSYWKAELEKGWAAEIRNKPSPYGDVLALTSRQLDKTVRQLYDSLKETPVQAAKSEPRDNEKTSETDEKQATVKEIKNDPSQREERHDEDKDAAKKDARPDQSANQQDPVVAAILSRKVVDRRNEPDGVLVLTENSGVSCKATFVGIATNISSQMVFSASDPETSADTVFNAIKPQIGVMLAAVVERWKDEQGMLSFLKKKKSPELKLFVVIESSEVRHRMSLILNRKIDEAVADWVAGQPSGTPSIGLDWKVGLTYDPADTVK